MSSQRFPPQFKEEAVRQIVERGGSGALAAQENWRFGGSDLNIKLNREPVPKAA
jgi:hypothetical protein